MLFQLDSIESMLIPAGIPFEEFWITQVDFQLITVEDFEIKRDSSWITYYLVQFQLELL